MTDDGLAREDDVPTHPGAAAYEAHLMRLARELPSFERELRRVEARSVGGRWAVATCREVCWLCLRPQELDELNKRRAVFVDQALGRSREASNVRLGRVVHREVAAAELPLYTPVSGGLVRPVE
jgi:hypothetical protein